MMKVRFLQDYQGQHTGPHFYLAGQVADVDDSAAARLIADNRAVAVGGPVGNEPDYAAMTVAELRDIAGERGISTSGLRKAQIVEMLEA
jgi:hypothetical protein